MSDMSEQVWKVLRAKEAEEAAKPLTLPKALTKLGLIEPEHKYAFGALFVGTALLALRPKLMFDDDELPRRWIVPAYLKGEEGLDQTTPLPWWLASLLAGVVLAAY